jgi:hypothetical protein
MAGAGFHWTLLRASDERRRWLRAAALLSSALALVLLAALWLEPDGVRALAALAAVLAAAWAGAESGRAPPPYALHIDADGVIWGRAGEVAERAPPLRLRACVVASRLVTLDGDAGPVAVWRDALPVDGFRRLCVHARWHLDRGDRGGGPQPLASSDGD